MRTYFFLSLVTIMILSTAFYTNYLDRVSYEEQLKQQALEMTYATLVIIDTLDQLALCQAGSGKRALYSL